MNKQNRQFDDRIWQAIDQRLSAEQWEQFQDELVNNLQFRDAYLKALRLTQALTELANTIGTSSELDSTKLADVAREIHRSPTHNTSRRYSWVPACLAAVAAIVLLWLAGSWLLPWSGRAGTEPAPFASTSPAEQETMLSGHAVLNRSVNVPWSEADAIYFPGDVLPGGEFHLPGGVIELDMFCGARVTVEGPATLVFLSDWVLEVRQGRLKATVPPVARGFTVQAADRRIVDLGTEFAVLVEPDGASVSVLDGEVELHSVGDPPRLLRQGDRWNLAGANTDDELVQSIEELEAALADGTRQALAREAAWEAASRTVEEDPRLIAYFPIARVYRDGQHGFSAAGPAAGSIEALLVGPVRSDWNRFGTQRTALEFQRLGARIRTHIPGEFSALTLACWARIDGLNNRYNALFMADGYENGEPHWQVRDDGRLMFSVMVDDSQKIEFFNERDQRVVRDAGLHRVYFTEPILDVSLQGKWLHLAASYDPTNRIVRQFVNGKIVSEHTIEPKFLVRQLRIGNAEIGNWGQPFRKTSWFAIRNLHGAIDELAIYGAALSPEEIAAIFEASKPAAY
ncbi:MAG: hypothetical protein KatS3mg111_0691 [Pirellulaceae bacterium]|nr:MAG: hypothetical protein KatS3mg111_0691 [Pirellulaceae bacterium]